MSKPSLDYERFRLRAPYTELENNNASPAAWREALKFIEHIDIKRVRSFKISVCFKPKPKLPTRRQIIHKLEQEQDGGYSWIFCGIVSSDSARAGAWHTVNCKRCLAKKRKKK